MFHVVLYQPEIPPNTGNIIRLCANTGSALHLIRPLGFDLEDRKLRRAGLDYREWTSVRVHESLTDFRASVTHGRLWGVSTRGACHYARASYQPGDVFVFGPETRGLPAGILASLGPESVLYLPMVPNSRSLNLANTVAVVVYEAWRQQGYTGASV